ncbi:FMN-binding protein [Microbacterium sp. 1P10UB]|uniref:FMN-binding protein n=1 Tax=unclassified Microbacterium TaxID=2609290 RepID=UPI0039A1795C
MKRATLTSVLASVALLLGGWQIGAHTLAATLGTTPLSASVPAGTGNTPPVPSTPSAAVAPSSGLKDGTFTGASTQTRYGNVQVQVTVSGGQITDVSALQLTNRDRESAQISNHAAPLLRQEVIASQSAKVSNVSGATYTTDGYLTSVQSALDQARS